jgi:hypothetical protein
MQPLFPRIENRTALLAVAPIALAEPWQAECLSSYLTRLSGEHGVAPRDMVRRVIAPALGRAVDTRAVFMRRHAHSIDGLGRYASLFSDCLRRLTDRQDLVQATLLGLAPLLPSNGTALLRSSRAWCPACWQDDTAARCRRYGRLVWRLELTMCCELHSAPLEKRCPHCGTTQPIIPTLSAMDRCERCHRCLIEDRAAGAAPTPTDTSSSAFAADLVGLRRTLPTDAHRSFLQGLRIAVAQTGLDRKAWCRAVGLPPRALCGWFSKGQRPSAEMLFRVTTALRAPLHELVSGRVRRGATARAPARRGRVYHSEVVRERVRLDLQAVLGQDSPPALKAIASAHGVSRAYLTYWYPQLARKLTRRRAVLRSAKHFAEGVRRQNALVAAVQGQWSAHGKVTRRSTERALLKNGVSLRQPEVRASFYKAVRRQRCMIDPDAQPPRSDVPFPLR